MFADYAEGKLILTTEHGTATGPTNLIVLDSDAVESLMIYVNMIKDAKGRDE